MMIATQAISSGKIAAAKARSTMCAIRLVQYAPLSSSSAVEFLDGSGGAQRMLRGRREPQHHHDDTAGHAQPPAGMARGGDARVAGVLATHDDRADDRHAQRDAHEAARR